MMKFKTQRERLASKLQALRSKVWPLMHASMEVQYRWFKRILQGHNLTMVVPTTSGRSDSFGKGYVRFGIVCSGDEVRKSEPSMDYV